MVQGIRYGILMTLITVVPTTINDYVVYNLPHTLVLQWMIAGIVYADPDRPRRGDPEEIQDNLSGS